MNIQKWLFPIVSIVICFSLTNCGSEAPPVKTESPPPMASEDLSRPDAAPVQESVSNLLVELGDEYPDYGMYTYVLYRWNTRDCTSEAGCEKLRVLFSYLQNLSTGDQIQGHDTRLFNSFYIPVRQVDSAGDTLNANLTLENYNSDAARELLRRFALSLEASHSDIAHLFRDNTTIGPFLITVSRPVLELQEHYTDFPMLYVDLSKVDTECVAEYYMAYMTELTETPLTSPQVFESFKLRLLNMGLGTLRACKLVYGNVFALLGHD